MSIQPYNEEQNDALQEIVNIGMGQAGSSLACILDVFVALSVPRIQLVEVTDIVNTVSRMIDAHQEVSAVRQAFYNQFQGEAIVIFKQGSCNDLASLIGHDQEHEARNEQELLLDIANILAGACLSGIAEQLDIDLSYSAPSIMAENADINDVLNPQTLSWSHALLLEVNFTLENSNFKSHLLILMTEESIDLLRDTLDHFMEVI